MFWRRHVNILPLKNFRNRCEYFRDLFTADFRISRSGTAQLTRVSPTDRRENNLNSRALM